MVIVPTEKRFDRERAPFVLFALVLLNILIFFLYQSNDQEKLFRALSGYEEAGYLSYEWPLFEGYLEAQPEAAAERLAEYRQLYQDGDHAELSMYLLSDAEFFPYLKDNRLNLPASEDFSYWETRASIDDHIQSMSYLAYGLKPSDLRPVTLITHQFLHGGMMHLAGNLFFLMVCGFAVEAAIGHLRFLLFYLVTGVVGGLLHVLFNSGSTVPLVGASGAISGVMAMYLGVFRLKKIEFFYWFFIFVGYFRAPAIAILPFYIGKELYSYATDVESNVAFMAHVGGFIAGGGLMAAALWLRPTIFDDDYIEDDQQAPPLQKDLATVYAHVERFNFTAALKALDQLERSHGRRFDTVLLRYNLLKLNPDTVFRNCALTLLQQERLRPAELRKVEEIWEENPELHAEMADDALLKLGWRLTALPDIGASERIFAQLYEREPRSRSLGNFARKLAAVHDGLGNRRKQAQYQQLANQLTQA